jgi:hypothetical protein
MQKKRHFQLLTPVCTDGLTSHLPFNALGKCSFQRFTQRTTVNILFQRGSIKQFMPTAAPMNAIGGAGHTTQKDNQLI